MPYFILFFSLVSLAFLIFILTGPKVPANTNQLLAEIETQPLPEFIKGQTGTAQNGTVSIFYEAMGEAVKGDILLINGHTQTILDWPSYFIEPLVAAGYRVIRYDNRGVGMSDWMAHWEKARAYTLEEMATDGVAVLDALDIKKAHVIGQSMGGMIGQRIAISHKDRILSLTSIMSTGFYYDAELGNVPKKFMADITRIGLRYGSQLKTETGKAKLHLAIRQILKGKGDYPFDTKYVLQKALYELRKRRGYNMKATDQHSFAIKKSGSRYEGLKQLQLPVLVVHGTTDPLINFVHPKKYAPMIPNAETLFIDGMGHDIPAAHSPQIVERILSML